MLSFVERTAATLQVSPSRCCKCARNASDSIMKRSTDISREIQTYFLHMGMQVCLEILACPLVKPWAQNV